MENPKRICLNCGKPIKGRADKKFCDDNCRNTYNNENNSDANNLVRNINNILRKNRRILKGFVSEETGVGKTTRDKFVKKGFNFKHFTHFYETQKGQTYLFCYEYGYLPLEDNWILVVKRKDKGL